MAFKPIWSLGLMSGTSMDGVDAALLKTDGETISAFGPSLEISPAYNEDHKAHIDHAGFEAMQEIAEGHPHDPALRALAESQIDDIHFAAVTALRAKSEIHPAVIGFHGQTIYHDPERSKTVQIGSGEKLARRCNLPTVWDFRSADMTAGGEGAPLAPFFHFALAKHIGAMEPLCFLNIGGVANLTWVDPTKSAPEDKGALLAFDTGPGNALINDWMAQHDAGLLDMDGVEASKGRVDHDLLAGNAANAFLKRTPPKSLDRNEFAMILNRMEHLSLMDGAATLTAFTAETIRAAQPHLPSPPSRWLICGGGGKNPTMMRMLSDALNAPVQTVETVGLNGDMLEAQAFAYLAVRSLRGLPLSAPSTTGCAHPVAGGRISRPA